MGVRSGCSVEFGCTLTRYREIAPCCFLVSLRAMEANMPRYSPYVPVYETQVACRRRCGNGLWWSVVEAKFKPRKRQQEDTEIDIGSRQVVAGYRVGCMFGLAV